jgi:hypothetical protein
VKGDRCRLCGQTLPDPSRKPLTIQDIRKATIIAAQERGGFIWEGARPAYERGEYVDHDIAEMLGRGWLVPHPDPKKGWIPK